MPDALTGSGSPAPGSAGWQPSLVALDIDGTLLKWVPGAGQTYEQIPAATYDAVRRAREAGGERGFRRINDQNVNLPAVARLCRKIAALDFKMLHARRKRF